MPDYNTILEMLFVYKQKQKHAKNQLSLAADPNRCRPGEGNNPDINTIFKFIFHFVGAKVPGLGTVTSVA